jgi:hypothetical protein
LAKSFCGSLPLWLHHKIDPPPFPRKIKFKILIIIIIIIIIKVHKSTHVSGLKIDLYLKFAGLKLELVSGGN